MALVPEAILEKLEPMPTCLLLAVACPQYGTWLNAFPFSALGLTMDDKVV